MCLIFSLKKQTHSFFLLIPAKKFHFDLSNRESLYPKVVWLVLGGVTLIWLVFGCSRHNLVRFVFWYYPLVNPFN